MIHGIIDLSNFEYLIVYSEPNKVDVVNTWTLPEGSFQMNYESMIKRGCIIHNVFHRMTREDIWSAMSKG